MESRSEKYYQEDSQQSSSSNLTRSSRNSRLYKQVYGKYGDLDNLPIEDNTDEIDMEKLKELVSNSVSKKEVREQKESLNILEQRKRQIDEQKLYDINKILEKAKYENNKLKEPTSSISKVNKNILSTLSSTELSLSEIKEASEKYEKQSMLPESVHEEQLFMTREIKYQNLTTEPKQNALMDNVMSDNDLSLDLFQDLKPTENTITTKPIRENEEQSPIVREDFHSTDTRDIDIIKQTENNSSNDFFTSSYEFSKKDFAGLDDDFYDTKKSSGILKIILLILAITVFIGVIVYFVGTYGLGV